MNAVRTTTVRSTDGTALAVSETGDPEGPLVLLIHGYPDNQSVWRHVVPILAAGHHVVAYDVRGAGQSGKPRRAAAYDFAQLVDDALAVAEAVAPGRPFHLVGHDWGAIAGWALVSSDKARGRALSFTAVAGVHLDHVAHLLRRRLTRPSPGNVRRASGQFLKSWYVYLFSVPGVAELACRLPRSPRGRDAGHGTWLYRRNMLRRLLSPAPSPVAHVPVQLVVPDRDPFISPRSHDGLEEWVPQGLWRRPAPGGHWVPLERPAELAAWVSGFVAAVEALAAAPEGGPSEPRRRRPRRVHLPGHGVGVAHADLAFEAVGVGEEEREQGAEVGHETVAGAALDQAPADLAEGLERGRLEADVVEAPAAEHGDLPFGLGVAVDLEDVELGEGADVDERQAQSRPGLDVGRDVRVEDLPVEGVEAVGVVGEDGDVVHPVEQHGLPPVGGGGKVRAAQAAQ